MDFLSLTQTETSIENLDIHFNPDGWGPVAGEKLDIFGDVPYSHFDKKDKLGRHADFVISNYPSYNQKTTSYQKRRDDYFQNNDFSFKHDAAEDSTFQLVDTSKTQSKNKFGAARNTAQRQQQRTNAQQNANRTAANANNRNAGARGAPIQPNNNKQTAGRYNNRRMDRKQDRVPSLAVGGDWDMIEEFDLAQLLKLAANIPKVQDLTVAGHLDQYDENFDKLTTRTAKLLKRVENKFFCDVTTSEDPVLERLAVEQVGDVYATDAILAQLMAAPRSVYSWDIVIEKVQGIIFLDKRENSSFDLLTVSETAHEPPSASEEFDEINHPDKLSVEATMINQNFSQQVLMDNVDGVRKSYEPNPFAEELEAGMEAASVAYKYRLFTLGNIRLVARCEVHCWTNKRGEEQLVSCHALHEWDSRFSGGVQWRQKIDAQRGAVLATELKNNSCRLARWTAQSLLAGADQMKLGYVSRTNPANPYEHAILATQFFKPKDFAQQINLSLTNVWGIVKMICELLLSKGDGKYVLLKDPNKAIVRLYSIPIDAFDAEEEEENSENEEEGDEQEE
eukprot:CAMPEP_0185016672 /NCGR_PEP_ID=MMETSP1098-20130426/100494_1 /TAXON_ID=89044 /ORGANISM="Spumella elongata, Strain CCAP 955/1" /LENGTH=563 /DNA_ID=CAMNT_0027545891 /DNA_START=52 /DNA_END=1743 /DNA_ORIENTATION=-